MHMCKKILWKVNNKTLTKISLEEETGIYVMGGKHYLFFKKNVISLFTLFMNACSIYIHVLLG